MIAAWKISRLLGMTRQRESLGNISGKNQTQMENYFGRSLKELMARCRVFGGVEGKMGDVKEIISSFIRIALYIDISPPAVRITTQTSLYQT